MLKTFLRISFIFLLLIAFVLICNLVNNPNRPKHLTYLPADSKIILVLNSRELALSMWQIALFKQKDFYSLLSEEPGNESTFIRDGNAGIDFYSLFTIIIHGDGLYLFADIKNKTDFENFLHKKSFIKENYGNYIEATNDKQKIYFNDEILIYEIKKDNLATEKKIAGWIKKENTITQNIINTIYNSKKHLGIYYFKNHINTFDLSVNFDADAILLEGMLTQENTPARKIICSRDISFFEKNNFAVYSSERLFSVPFEDLFPEEISSMEILKILFKNHNQQYVYAYADKVISSHIYLPKTDKTVTDFKKLPFYMPVLRLAFSIDSKENVINDLNTFWQDTTLIAYENYYELKLPYDYSLYFKLFDKHIAVSVDTNFITHIPGPEETGFSYLYYSNIENYTRAIPTFSPDGFMIKSFLEMKSKINRIYMYATRSEDKKIFFTGKAYIGNEEIHSLVETIKILLGNVTFN